MLTPAGRTDLAGPGGTLSVLVEADESLAAAPRAVRRRTDGTGNDAVATVTDLGARQYLVSSTALNDDGHDEDGAWEFHITTTVDVAGNSGADLDVGGFIIDTTPPQFTAPCAGCAPGAALDTNTISREPDFDTAVLTFVLDEPATATVSLASGATFASVRGTSFEDVINAADIAVADEGANVVFINVVDDAGPDGRADGRRCRTADV